MATACLLLVHLRAKRLLTHALLLLQLYSNDFYGCLPATWPDNLPNLTHLTVQGNQLSGELPSSYDDWNSLTSMYVSAHHRTDLCVCLSIYLSVCHSTYLSVVYLSIFAQAAATMPAVARMHREHMPVLSGRAAAAVHTTTADTASLSTACSLHNSCTPVHLQQHCQQHYYMNSSVAAAVHYLQTYWFCAALAPPDPDEIVACINCLSML